MSAPHVFVDESKAKGLLVAAAVLDPTDLATARAAMRALVFSGSHRVHMKGESDRHRKTVVAALVTLPVVVDIYDAKSYAPREALDARQRCLDQLVANLSRSGCARLVLERDDSLAIHDRRTLYAAGRRYGLDGSWRYEHLRANEEPLLWIADIVAWCWPKGGAWRRSVLPIVRQVYSL